MMKKTFLSLVLASMALGSTAHAQTQLDPQNMGAAMAKAHGGMEEVARQCGLHTAAELTTMKANNQQQLAAQNQLPAAQFETIHAQGAAEVKARFAPLTPAQKTQACNQAKQYQNIPNPRSR